MPFNKTKIALLLFCALAFMLLPQISFAQDDEYDDDAGGGSTSMSYDDDSNGDGNYGEPDTGVVAGEPAPNPGAVESKQEAPPPTPPVCNYSEFVGLASDEAAAKLKEIGKITRVLWPNMMATQEYNPDRVNLNVDENGTVISITCG